MSDRNGGDLGPGFRALFLGVLASNTGDGIRLAALPLLALSLTDSPFLISLVTVAQYLPWLVFAPVGGALVDRWSRRRTILVTQAWRGLVMVALVLLVATDRAELWHLAVVAFVITVGEILVDPATVALVPNVVRDEQLERANSRIASAEILTNDVGGGPVGSTLFGFAPWLPFVVDAASYLGSVVPFRGLPRDPGRSDASGSLRSSATSVVTEAREGFGWLRRHPVLGPLTVAQVVYFFGLAASLSLFVVVVVDELGASEAAFGVLLAVGAVGALFGTTLAPRVAARGWTNAAIVGGVVVQGVTLAITPLAPVVAVAGVLWFLNGVPAGLSRPLVRGIQQRHTPNELLGRINVTTRIFTRGVIILGALVAGSTAAIVDVRAAFAVAGAAQLVSALMMWRALGRSAVTESA